ncbi:MAG TPA: polysaccharide deacetylase family protein [Polyangiaceae bacterium]|nr:polysaccharide deacetylase family protein [Polyangiaceae bacterium]
MKHLISVSALILSAVACSSDPGTNGGSSGSNNTSAGANASGGKASGGSGSGLAGNPSTGGGGAAATAGSSGNTAGAAPTAGSPGTGGTGAGGTGAGGKNAGGTSSGGASAGGAPPTGGTGPTASFKCDNLSLAPSTTGVAKPSGAAGGLKVIDWAGFKGAASFTFDDNRPSQMDSYSALKATGAHFTWFLIASSASASSYKPTMADGQEIANHTQTHPQSNPTQAEVTNAQNTLKTNFGVDVHSMAAPNCADGWKPFGAPAKLFQDRGPCGGGTIAPRDSKVDPLWLPAYMPTEGAPASEITGQLAMGKWAIFVVHGFVNDGGMTYHPVPIANMTAAMSKAVSDGYWPETMTNVGAYFQGQRLIPESATTSATWTLPANFPPNMCVRITTTGGTVTQKGETIAWDSHGYYQISLDAGEVTIK